MRDHEFRDTLSDEDKEIFDTLVTISSDIVTAWDDAIALAEATTQSMISRKTGMKIFGIDYDKEMEALCK